MTSNAVKKTEESYDEVPYESFAYPQTHARHLYTVSKLFGLNPPDFTTARVLEIGCASGGNLFSQALNYPKASFTGFDLSREQIAIGNKQKAEMNLKNIELRQQDILNFDLEKEAGKYDYIIAHGVFSWVPESVRSALLELCAKALSPNGVAVISYNALPGWNAVRSLREMMMYHANRFQTPAEKVAQARALLDFLLESVPEGNAAYRALIQSERDLLKNLNDTYLFHEHLEEINSQFYLNDFVGQARAKGLEYVGDSTLSSMYVGNMPQKALEALRALNDIVAQEQYMDFVTNRRFRSTILARQGVKISRDLKPEAIFNYYLTSAFAPDPKIPATKEKASFSAVSGMHFTVTGAAIVALCNALHTNGARPISATDLIAKAEKESGVSADLLHRDLLMNGLQLTLMGHIVLHADSPDVARTLSAKPVAFPLARVQASRPGCVYVTNILSNAVKTDEAGAIIIAGLDGTRDAKAIVDLLVKGIADGRLKATKDGKPVTDGNAIRPQLEGTVNVMLPRLLNESLLVK
jgi:methyltransferase-like protein/2-polyprenyl-3-methyl-5-hydroxy-6-metoxy-1,4-benzoquinol methylase